MDTIKSIGIGSLIGEVFYSIIEVFKKNIFLLIGIFAGYISIWFGFYKVIYYFDQHKFIPSQIIWVIIAYLSNITNLLMFVSILYIFQKEYAGVIQNKTIIFFIILFSPLFLIGANNILVIFRIEAWFLQVFPRGDLILTYL